MFSKFKLTTAAVVFAIFAINPAYAGPSTSSFMFKEQVKPGFGLKANGGGNTKAEDLYCTNGGKLTVNVPWHCGSTFTADCKKLGGTISKDQPWGGRTCHMPS